MRRDRRTKAWTDKCTDIVACVCVRTWAPAHLGSGTLGLWHTCQSGGVRAHNALDCVQRFQSPRCALMSRG
eukprot:350563-Chlamydomonas_euryale.AAC.3